MIISFLQICRQHPVMGIFFTIKILISFFYPEENTFLVCFWSVCFSIFGNICYPQVGPLLLSLWIQNALLPFHLQTSQSWGARSQMTFYPLLTVLLVQLYHFYLWLHPSFILAGSMFDQGRERGVTWCLAGPHLRSARGRRGLICTTLTHLAADTLQSGSAPAG